VNTFQKIFFRWVGQQLSKKKEKAKLLVLMYHRILPEPDHILCDDVDVESFNWQMSILKNYYNVLPLQEAVQSLLAGKLIKPSVCVTFDDGYMDNYELALPVLKDKGLPATFFIATQFINTGRMWNDTVIETIRRIPNGELDLRSIGQDVYNISTLSDRLEAIKKILLNLKYLEPDERLNRVTDISAYANSKLPDNLMMSEKQLKEMDSSGMTIGAHTHSHPILSRIPLTRAEDEIRRSRDILNELLNKKIKTFAYPNGRPNKDYNNSHVEIVKKLEFEVAVSTQWGYAHNNSDVYQIPRISLWDKTPLRFNLRMLRTYLS
jgi:peptidoglycan/xylan/chitin deacetylase (PgdA/CDA1 family)